MPKKRKLYNDLKNYIDLFIIPKGKLFFLAVYRKIKAQSWVARPDKCDIGRGHVLNNRSLQNINFTPKSVAQRDSCVLN